ncbi:unnamed protein product [Heligmosomoides polygyrus]|uniref:TIP120 domain-containing protein n=1 Tax=Heligmosomoides polygyrus TaxID=6339 RepID=A0A3P7ZSL5_HELPZ|nr:unnamed protein product [Heligmosomoides polygyrus]
MHHDIRLLSYLVLMKLAMLCPNQLVQLLGNICQFLKPKSNAVKQEIDKQDELKRALIRVVLASQDIDLCTMFFGKLKAFLGETPQGSNRAVNLIQPLLYAVTNRVLSEMSNRECVVYTETTYLPKIPDAERHQQLTDVASMMRSSAELRALTEVVQRDAMRTFATGEVPMDTI